ncbi:RHS repeat-associated core domain-containing protein [bacterium]|nr:RHS repeat-associated core domain-containing protein [bacterium]NUN46652.1 RHS repeat-associated core domain-containing protein [bacterium]
MTSDKSKGITSIEYNYLNLPTKVEFGSSNNRIEWTYTVSGVKLEKRVYTSGNLTLTQNYVSRFVYKNGILDFFSTETGRIKRKSNGILRYEYTLADHLGNARVTFTDDDANGSAETLEYSAYYAFGMRIEGLSTSNPDNKFTYNGKELENDLGLGWYDYQARYYDPQLGRWHAIDPAGEFISPYAYVGNDPVNLVDPDGTESEGGNNGVALIIVGGDESGLKDKNGHEAWEGFQAYAEARARELEAAGYQKDNIKIVNVNKASEVSSIPKEIGNVQQVTKVILVSHAGEGILGDHFGFNATKNSSGTKDITEQMSGTEIFKTLSDGGVSFSKDVSVELVGCNSAGAVGLVFANLFQGSKNVSVTGYDDYIWVGDTKDGKPVLTPLNQKKTLEQITVKRGK